MTKKKISTMAKQILAITDTAFAKPSSARRQQRRVTNAAHKKKSRSRG